MKLYDSASCADRHGIFATPMRIQGPALAKPLDACSSESPTKVKIRDDLPGWLVDDVESILAGRADAVDDSYTSVAMLIDALSAACPGAMNARLRMLVEGAFEEHEVEQSIKKDISIVGYLDSAKASGFVDKRDGRFVIEKEALASIRRAFLASSTDRDGDSCHANVRKAIMREMAYRQQSRRELFYWLVDQEGGRWKAYGKGAFALADGCMEPCASGIDVGDKHALFVEAAIASIGQGILLDDDIVLHPACIVRTKKTYSASFTKDSWIGVVDALPRLKGSTEALGDALFIDASSIDGLVIHQTYSMRHSDKVWAEGLKAALAINENADITIRVPMRHVEALAAKALADAAYGEGADLRSDSFLMMNGLSSVVPGVLCADGDPIFLAPTCMRVSPLSEAFEGRIRRMLFDDLAIFSPHDAALCILAAKQVR